MLKTKPVPQRVEIVFKLSTGSDKLKAVPSLLNSRSWLYLNTKNFLGGWQQEFRLANRLRISGKPRCATFLAKKSNQIKKIKKIKKNQKYQKYLFVGGRRELVGSRRKSSYQAGSSQLKVFETRDRDCAPSFFQIESTEEPEAEPKSKKANSSGQICTGQRSGSHTTGSDHFVVILSS